MILNQNSILKRLPIQLNKKQFLIFDAIRFSAEIIDTCWSNLNSLIEKMSVEEPDYIKDHARLFTEAWNIIDTTKRIIGLHSRMTIETQEDLMKPIYYVKDFRNTYQHLDERIEEAFIESKIPVYGILTWSYNNPKTIKVEGFITSSGIERYSSEFHFVVPSFNDSKAIENIRLETIIRTKNKFEKSQLDFTKLISSLEEIIQFMEEDLKSKFLENNIKTVDWSKRRDILLRIKS